MKKKIVSACVVAALAACAFGGATLAYFTDTEGTLNSFTVGNVDIALEEEFVSGSELMPGIDVNKDAWIENTGDNDAYVWAEVLIPSALDDADGNSPEAPGLGNSLHFNFPGMYAKEYAQNTSTEGKWYNADLSKLWIHQYTDDVVNCGYAGTVEINGVLYNKFLALYTEVLEPGEETSLFLDKVYMDSKVTQGNSDDFILADGETHYAGDWNIIVNAYGIQAAGFDNVVAAWKAYDGEVLA